MRTSASSDELLLVRLRASLGRMGDAPLWIVVAVGAFSLVPDVVLAGLWVTARATGRHVGRYSVRPASALSFAATMAVVFVAALLTRDWILVALLAAPSVIFLVLAIRAAAQATRLHR
jgi:hypothetical protein